MGINTKCQTDVKALVLKSKAAVQAITKMALEQIAQDLMDYSPLGNPALWHPPHWPKGYEPGRFRANWQLGIDAIPKGQTDAYRKGHHTDGQEIVEEMQAEIPRWAVGHIYYFTNNAPYAMALERGTLSQQIPPQGMVGRVQANFNEIWREAQMNYIHKG